MSARNLLS